MKTKRTLLATLAGLITLGAVAFAGPDTWRQPAPFKPASKQCCTVCPADGSCCTANHRYQPGPGGRGLTRTTTVLCKDSCKMPAKERGCCASGCVR